MTRERILLIFDEHYAANGHVVYAAVHELLGQRLADFEYRVVCRGRYRGPIFDSKLRVRVKGVPVAPIGRERRLLDRLRRKLAPFHVLEAADRWISNVDAADRPALQALYEADSLHAVIVFTVDPAYGLAMARLAHIYATTDVPHIIVVTSASTVLPQVLADLRWLRARILRDGHPVVGAPVRPGPGRVPSSAQGSATPDSVLGPPTLGPAKVTDLMAVAAIFDSSLPLVFLDPEAYPSQGVQPYARANWRDWVGLNLPYPRRVRDVVLFIRPDWMVCGSGTIFESLARWFRDNDTLLIDIGIWPYAVPFNETEVREKLVEQETQLGSALYFSLRESNSLLHILRQFGHLKRWLPSSTVNQMMLLHTRAAKPHIMTQAVRRAKISHIYVNHYFTYLFAEDMIAGRKFFLDTHDVQAINFVHNGARNFLTWREDRFERMLGHEMKVAALADRLGFISSEEMALAARFLPPEKLDFIIALPRIQPSRPRPMGKIPNLLVVASNNRANQRNMTWMFERVLPALAELVAQLPANMMKMPMPEINVCGSISKVLPRVSLPFVRINGVVPDLREYYERADIVLLPVISGGGVAIKTIEALLYERPVVATRHAMRGLTDAVADTVGYENDPSAFAREIIRLLRSERARQHQTERVRRAAQILRNEGFYDRLRNAMEAVRL